MAKITEEQLEQIATISANNDSVIGALIAEAFEKVTVDDIMRIAKKAMSQPPSISCVGGDLSGVPTFEQIKHIRVN